LILRIEFWGNFGLLDEQKGRKPAESNIGRKMKLNNSKSRFASQDALSGGNQHGFDTVGGSVSIHDCLFALDQTV